MMSHGLHATAKATDVVLRQISFFHFDRASNWIPLSDVLCGTYNPPYRSSKLGAEPRQRKPLCLHLRIAETQPPSPLARKTLLQRLPPAPQGGRRP